MSEGLQTLRVQPQRLVVGVDWADCQGIDAAGHQVLDNLFLFGGGSLVGESYVDFNVKVLGRIIAADFCDVPEAGDLVGDKGNRRAVFVGSRCFIGGIR